jgi:glycoside/pentoside/hexuronide:cation symporter, GPH family
MNEPAAAFTAPGGWREGLRYGLLGLPLAFVALPLYVLWPNHYARELGVPLAALGLVLLGARLFDAVLDPWIGRLCDRLFSHSPRALMGAAAAAALLLWLGFAGLFFPPAWLGQGPQATGALLAWALALLALTYTAYSVVMVAHQSWGARLGGTEAQRSRVVAWREGWGLAGVILAAVLPSVLGLGITVTVFAVALVLGGWAWSRAIVPAASANTGLGAGLVQLWRPLRQPAFRRLLGVFMLNGIASAVPATLVLFFVQDRLQAPAGLEGLFLGAYFLSAALSLPLWLRLVGRMGLQRAWLGGMLLAMAVFIWAAWLGPGDIWPFVLVCVLSGLALGADLALPSAWLAGLIGELGERGRGEGAYFGWWSLVTKLNLALAAGLSLPLLAGFGYTPGQRDPQALQALVIAYCVLPCVLKALAALVLHRMISPRTPR